MNRIQAIFYLYSFHSVLTAALDKLNQCYEHNPKRRKIRRELVVAIYVLVSFIFGLLMTTRAGFYIFNMFDSYVCGAIPLLIICIFELATVLFGYRNNTSSWSAHWPGRSFIENIKLVSIK